MSFATCGYSTVAIRSKICCSSITTPHFAPSCRFRLSPGQPTTTSHACYQVCMYFTYPCTTVVHTVSENIMSDSEGRHIKNHDESFVSTCMHCNTSSRPHPTQTDRQRRARPPARTHTFTMHTHASKNNRQQQQQQQMENAACACLPS